jgi:polyisoprenyl-phosphate glycosyltransferase
MTNIDVIVPVRNEEQSIPVFLDQVAALKLPEGVALRIVLVEDSSTDGTRPLLRRLAAENRNLVYYSLVKGFGQGAAVTFGLSRSHADGVVMMDGDGGHPPRVIPDLVAAFLDGAEVVQCVRTSAANRRRYREWASALFFAGSRVLTGVDLRTQNVFFRLVSQKVVRQILSEPRYWTYLRFPPPPEPRFRTIEVDMEERQLGESKYGFWRLARVAVDGVLSLIPPVRFAALLAPAGLLAALLCWVGAWPLALGVGGGMAWLLHSYRRLRRGDLLERMQILECGGVVTPDGANPS